MDPDAFERLFEDEFDRVYGYLARRVGRELASDLAAETFTTAFAARRRFDPALGEPRPWLLGIATNLLRRHYREEERRLRALARIEPAREDASSPDEPRLAAALAGLSREERDVLLLYTWADMSYDEIADALNVPVGTVRSRLHRARERLRAALTQVEALDG